MNRKNKTRTRTATRLCATCGTPFTWTSRNPRRRFCHPVCKARWWRAANTDTTTAEPDPGDTTATTSTTSTTSTTNPEPTTTTTNTTNAESTTAAAGTTNAESTTAAAGTTNAESTTAAAGTTNAESTTGAAGTTNAVTPEYDPYVAGYRTERTPSAVQNCPNCNQPIAVINLLVKPAAAYVNTPSRPVTDIR
jgi:endogenous inhibitor of DNA gyrase (YacG/DUF329 family)